MLIQNLLCDDAPEHPTTPADDQANHTLQALELALAANQRAEILEQFDRAVLVLTRSRRWHDGFALARRVYAAIQTWDACDASPYARVVAQFAHNDALEFMQVRLWEPAEVLLREALALFELCADGAGQCATEHQLGRVAQARGEFACAASFYRASLERAQALGDQSRVGRNLFELGSLKLAQGDLHASIEHYQRARYLARRTADNTLLAAASHQLGIIAQIRNDSASAAWWFHAARSIAQENNDAHGLADAEHQLGMLAQAAGEWTRAEERYRASLASAEYLDAATRVPSLYHLAQCAFRRGDIAAVRTHCNMSLAIAQASGDLAAIRRVRRLFNLLSAQLSHPNE